MNEICVASEYVGCYINQPRVCSSIRILVMYYIIRVDDILFYE